VPQVRCLNLGLGFDVSFRELHYMHANPVLRGLVKHSKDWPWSSWSFYEKGEVGSGLAAQANVNYNTREC
jgi:hypothetical protein